MEQQPHHQSGGDHPPETNSYGTDDPDVQARIEQARIDASRERRHNRTRLEQLVEQGMQPDDAEALIEFEDSTREQASEGERTSLEDTRADLAHMLELTQQPGGADVLAEFARSLRQDIGGEAADMPSDPAAVDRYRTAGIGGRSAATLAGFEYYLRTKLGIGNQPTEEPRGEKAPHYQPRIYVVDLASRERGIQRGLWIDADRNADELDADIAAMLDSSPTVGKQTWAVHAIEGFAGLDLHGFTDTALISRLARGVVDFGAAYAAWIAASGTKDRGLLDRFEDLYVGSYDTPEAWRRAVADDLQWPDQLDAALDPALRSYVTIDYGKVAREMRQGWDVLPGIDGKIHVFLR